MFVLIPYYDIKLYLMTASPGYMQFGIGHEEGKILVESIFISRREVFPNSNIPIFSAIPIITQST